MRTPSLAIAGAPLLLGLLLSTPGQAATMHANVSGDALKLDDPCAHDVTIHADGPPGQVTLDATAEQQAELDNLELTSGTTATVKTRSSRCPGNWLSGREPTLSLNLHIPHNAAVSISDGGAATYTITDPIGAFSLDGSGALSVTTATVGAASLELSGSGEVHITSANGPATIELSGSGKINLDTLTAPSLSVDSSGSGEITIRSGTIGRLAVNGSGDASLTIGGTVQDGTVEVSGSGDIHIARVLGRMDQSNSGSGRVEIGGR